MNFCDVYVEYKGYELDFLCLLSHVQEGKEGKSVEVLSQLFSLFNVLASAPCNRVVYVV